MGIEKDFEAIKTIAASNSTNVNPFFILSPIINYNIKKRIYKIFFLK